MPDRIKPAPGDALPAAQPSEETLRLLSMRRSTTAAMLRAPGPNADELGRILEIAARAPDHRMVTPFRFIVFEGEARERFGAELAKIFESNSRDANATKVALERGRFQRAPVVVALISSVDRAHKTPEWEQILTTGAVGQNLLIAACASGFAAQWITEWCAYDAQVHSLMALGEHERVAGFIYIGTAAENPVERPRPDLDKLVSRWG